MNTRQYLYFYTLATSRTISEAARKLNISEAALSKFLKTQEDYYNLHFFSRSGHQLTLTDSGREVAERIYERHNILSAILMRLGVDEQTATDDACKMEHYISDTSFQAIKKHLSEHPCQEL